MYSLGGVAIGTMIITLDLERYPSGYMGYNTAMNYGCAISQMLLALLLADHKMGSYRTHLMKQAAAAGPGALGTSGAGITDDMSSLKTSSNSDVVMDAVTSNHVQ